MNEREFIGEVVKLCDSLIPPVRWLHLEAVRKERCPWLDGFPDLQLMGSCALMWREVKCGGSTPTAEQDEYLTWLEDTGRDADVWTERDLYDGSVKAELLALNGISADREPWIPDGATPEEAAHRRALYGH